jgi:hypothetical protein
MLIFISNIIGKNFNITQCWKWPKRTIFTATPSYTSTTHTYKLNENWQNLKDLIKNRWWEFLQQQTYLPTKTIFKSFPWWNNPYSENFYILLLLVFLTVVLDVRSTYVTYFN